MRRSRSLALSRVPFYALLLVITAYIVFPFYWAVRSSITPNDELFTTPVQYWPSQPTLANYQQVLSDGHFLQALLNSSIVAISTTLLSLLIGVLGSYALGRLRFRGRRPTLYLILSMTMFPQIAVLGALFTRVTQVGLYNTLLALIITYLIFTLPFTVWVLTSFFEAMPRELEEAAYLDGATPLQAMYRVMLPLVAPGLVTTGILAFIQAWNEYLFALSFIQSPDRQTVPLALTSFHVSTGGGYELPWGPIMAATVVVTVPLIVLTLVFQRRILAGLTAGAVKG